ncbi:MAG TPA: DUF6364 family protein [Longimicrobium sp.]|nr:DUF6364 family protein [Longimicrobium sp.]
MAGKRLTLRVDDDVLRRARAYAEQHQTTVSQLVGIFLAGLDRNQRQDRIAAVQRLAGILPASTDEADYYRHLESRYLA